MIGYSRRSSRRQSARLPTIESRAYNSGTCCGLPPTIQSSRPPARPFCGTSRSASAPRSRCIRGDGGCSSRVSAASCRPARRFRNARSTHRGPPGYTNPVLYERTYRRRAHPLESAPDDPLSTRSARWRRGHWLIHHGGTRRSGSTPNLAPLVEFHEIVRRAFAARRTARHFRKGRWARIRPARGAAVRPPRELTRRPHRACVWRVLREQRATLRPNHAIAVLLFSRSTYGIEPPPRRSSRCWATSHPAARARAWPTARVAAPSARPRWTPSSG